MPELRTITLQLAPETHAALMNLAAAHDVSPGQAMRELLQRELSQRPAKRPNRAGEQLVARLQRLLAPTMASATCWADLQARLVRQGYQLRPAGGGLTLHDAGGARLCKSSELGFAYSRLVRTFGAPMPGHPHRMQHLLTKKAAEIAPDDPLELFEPF